MMSEPPQAGPRAARECLVTGANRGLGLEFTRQLLARGDRVVATCRAPAAADALQRLAGQHRGRLRVLALDVAAEPSRAALLATLYPARAAGAPLDLLLNNAGVLHAGERFGAVAAAQLEDSLRTNALGPFLLTQALAPHLADGAMVANLSSAMGSLARLDAFRAPSYAISKAALNMASALLARALAPRGIVVLALHPGWVRTELGGDTAPLTAAQSVAGLLAVIARAGAGDSGRFLDWQGAPVPW